MCMEPKITKKLEDFLGQRKISQTLTGPIDLLESHVLLIKKVLPKPTTDKIVSTDFTFFFHCSFSFLGFSF